MNRKRVLLMLCLFIGVALLVTACRPTPESEAIVNKGDGQLESVVLESGPNVENSSMEDSAVWDETKTVSVEGWGDTTVHVSMDVEIPDIPDAVPVYLIEPKEFGINFMQNAAKYLMKGEIYDGEETKEDVTRELLAGKQEISAHTIRDGYQQEYDNWLGFMNQRYDKAADSNTEARFEYDTSERTKSLNLKSYPDESCIMEFSTFMGADSYLFRACEFNRSFMYLSHIAGENMQANGTVMTYEQAQGIADEAISALFEEQFALARSNIIDIINDHEYLWSDKEDTSEGQAYVFYYTRKYDGIPSLFIADAPTVTTEETEYAEPYGREGVCVVVDERGIAEMGYDSYSNTIKTMNENVGMMPFDTILDKFKDGVFYHNLWRTEGRTEIEITRIEFGLIREPVADNPNQFMMVPAWNFVGNVSGWGEGGIDRSILALNAIDGSVVTHYNPMNDPK